MAERTSAGYLTNATGAKSKATAATGRFFVNLPHMPSVTLLFIDVISGAASINIEVRDGSSTGYIPIRTITADAVVKLAIPSSVFACNITANTGTVTITYRSIVVDQIPNLAIEVFTAGAVEPQGMSVSGTLTTREGTYKKLYQGQPTASIVAVYTVPANTQTKITYIVVTNTTVNDRTITLYHDGATAAFNILPASTVLAGGFAEYNGEILMEASDTLQAVASVTTTLTLTVYGIEKSTL